MAHNDYLDLAKRISLMCELFNRQLSDDAIAFWIEELQPIYGPHLFEALRVGCREKWMPSVGWVIDKAEEFKRLEENRKREEEFNRKNELLKAEYEKAKEKRNEDWNLLTQEQRDKYNSEYDVWKNSVSVYYRSMLRSDDGRGIDRFRQIEDRSFS